MTGERVKTLGNGLSRNAMGGTCRKKTQSDNTGSDVGEWHVNDHWKVGDDSLEPGIGHTGEIQAKSGRWGNQVVPREYSVPTDIHKQVSADQ